MQLVDQGLPPLSTDDQSGTPDDEATEEWVRRRRAAYAELEADTHEFLAEVGRRAYETGRENSWRELLDTDPSLVATQPDDLLESATLDTYLAIDARTATAEAS